MIQFYCPATVVPCSDDPLSLLDEQLVPVLQNCPASWSGLGLYSLSVQHSGSRPSDHRKFSERLSNQTVGTMSADRTKDVHRGTLSADTAKDVHRGALSADRANDIHRGALSADLRLLLDEGLEGGRLDGGRPHVGQLRVNGGSSVVEGGSLQDYTRRTH